MLWPISISWSAVLLFLCCNCLSNAYEITEKIQFPLWRLLMQLFSVLYELLVKYYSVVIFTFLFVSFFTFFFARNLQMWFQLYPLLRKYSDLLIIIADRRFSEQFFYMCLDHFKANFVFRQHPVWLWLHTGFLSLYDWMCLHTGYILLSMVSLRRAQLVA